MKHKPRQMWHHGIIVARILCLGGLLLAASWSSARAQDIRGLEVCTAEKQMDRRTSCLQANIEFLQQTLNKLAHDTQDKLAAASRDLIAAQAEIATLKTAVDKLNAELAQMKTKPEPSSKK
jgi:septal ring factor EnvC (AmiA/AmiB activator)